MTPKIQHIKLFIKTSIIVFVLAVFVVLGIFVRPNHTFENARMGKWLSLSEQQRVETIHRVVAQPVDQDLLVKCVDKIALLPHANDMQIQYAIVLCNQAVFQNEDLQK